MCQKLIVAGNEAIEDWLLNGLKDDLPGELRIIKHFRNKKTLSGMPDRLRKLCSLSHVGAQPRGYPAIFC